VSINNFRRSVSILKDITDAGNKKTNNKIMNGRGKGKAERETDINHFDWSDCS